MKLSISNIAWKNVNDDKMYDYMADNQYHLEIAPTRIFQESPYDHLIEAKAFAEYLRKRNIRICSLQSIWYGREESLFGTIEERTRLFQYTKKAILFAQTVGAENLVFGCPKNRNCKNNEEVAIPFFKQLSDFAKAHETVIGMEANPAIYNTNYINTTVEAIELVQKVNSPGFLLNLDIGAMIESGESVDLLRGKEHLINHIHISEPNLVTIKKRDIHHDLAEFLKKINYKRYISLEVKTQENIEVVKEMMGYLEKTFC